MRGIATALTAALVLAGAVGSASGNRLSVDNQRFRISWASLTLQSNFAAECDVTLEGSFHTTAIVKTAGRLIGYITRAISGTCVGGREMWMLSDTETLEGLPTFNTLPWHVRYRTFSGTLPTIRTVTVDIVSAGILIKEPLLRCLYRAENEFPWRGRFELNAEGRVTGFRSDETSPIRRLEGAGCNLEASMIGSGGVTRLGTTAMIRITLI